MPALRARAQELWDRHTTGRREELYGEPPARDTVPANVATGYDTISLTATDPTESSNRPTTRPAEPKDPNVTCAHFSIKPGKHKVALHFDPGISGRFILVKVWAEMGVVGGGRARNVDVQSIIAKGYGGCRFFPAREVR